MRGTAYPIAPTRDSGISSMFDHSGTTATGETWPHPYWVAVGGWCVRPFWDHYLVTGDLEFLRKRVVPAYKDLALFFEDFPHGHGQGRKLHLRPLLLAGETIPAA